jgi:hypothetical protein
VCGVESADSFGWLWKLRRREDGVMGARQSGGAAALGAREIGGYMSKAIVWMDRVSSTIIDGI